MDACDDVVGWEHHEKVYSDPSSAHEWAIRVEMRPATTKPMISHEGRGFVVRWMEQKKHC